MASPSYSTDLNDIYTDGGSWTTLTGRVTDPDTDDYIQGASCWSHDPFSSGIEGGVVNSSETITAGHAVFVWTKSDIGPALATKASGGVQVLIGNASNALKCYYVAGSDTLIYGGWKCIPVDPTKTPSTTVGSPTSATAYFGVRWNIPGSGPTKGYPLKIDAMRHGSKIEITAGDATTPATWDSVSAYDANNARMWGLVQPTNTGAAIQGDIYWGTATTAVYSRDSNRTIVVNDTEWTDTDFTQLIFPHASNDIIWDNVGVSALGTNNKGLIDITANGTIEWKNSIFQGIGTTDLGGTNSTFTNNKWIACDQITGNGATITGGEIKQSTASSALLVDTASEMSDITGVSFVDNNSGGTPVVANYYIDGSDATATDPDTNWTNDSNAFDGSTSTQASSGGTGSTSTNFLKAEGTDAPASGGIISQVRSRVRTTTFSGDYVTLSTPTGGWTWAKVQALETKIYQTGTGISAVVNGAIYTDSLGELLGTPSVAETGTGSTSCAIVDIEVTSSASHSIELTATGTHTFTDITFSGGGGTPGSNLVASTGSDYADVYNNSGGAVTINVSGGTTPSVRNAAGSTTTVNNNVTVTLTGLPTNVEVRIYNDTGSGVAGTEIDGIENTTGSTFAFSAAAAADVIITIFDEDYAPIRQLYTVPSSNAELPYSLITDGVYLNP